MSGNLGIYKKRDADEEYFREKDGSLEKNDISDSKIELQNIPTNSTNYDTEEKGIVNKGFQNDDVLDFSKSDTENIDEPNAIGDSTPSEINRDIDGVDNNVDQNQFKGVDEKLSADDEIQPISHYQSNFKELNNHKDHESVNINIQDEESGKSNFVEKSMDQIKKPLKYFYRTIKPFLPLLLLVAYIVFLGVAIAHDWDQCKNYCSGSKFLTVLSIVVFTGLLYFHVIKKYFSKSIGKCCSPLVQLIGKIVNLRCFALVTYIVMFAAMLIFIIIDSSENRERLISFAGLWVLLIFGYIFSKHPKKVIFRQVAWGVVLQFIFAILILRWEVGRSVFQCLGDKVSTFLSYTDQGSMFIYGYLVTGTLQSGNFSITNATVNNEVFAEGGRIAGLINLPPQPGVFAFKVLSVIFFFSFFVSVLFYYGALQWLIIKLGWCLQVTVGTTAAESVNASANIFLGQTEAPLIVRPFLHKMTKSELHAVMTGGFATIAGTVLAAYISFGVNASHLLSASVMSAPAALAYSKLFYPETEISRTNASDIKIEKPEENNALEAASKGVMNAIQLVFGIIANLIAFIAFIYFVDQVIMFLGSLVGWEISMTFFMSKFFMPLAYLMGIKWEECDKVGELIGIKTILNEFIAFQKLGEMKGTLSPRATAISTYALCGFSNLSSIGIQMGGLGAMAPSKIADLSQIAVRAMIAGSAACFMTACIAGALMKE